MDRAASIRRLEQIQLEVIENQYALWRTEGVEAGQPFPETLRKLIADAHSAMLNGHKSMPESPAATADRERLVLQLEEQLQQLRREAANETPAQGLMQ